MVSGTGSQTLCRVCFAPFLDPDVGVKFRFLKPRPVYLLLNWLSTHVFAPSEGVAEHYFRAFSLRALARALKTTIDLLSFCVRDKQAP